MSYFFQLITPGLILVIFQNRDVLYKYAVVTVPLILINFSLLCFWVLYSNKLSISQYIEWSKLYRYLFFADHILNSPVMVAEMVRFERVPVDSGQTEYFFNTRPYDSSLFVPEYERIHQQGRQYLETIRIEIQNQSYEYIFLASDKPELSLSRLADRSLVERFYDRVELIYIDMPQTNQHWDIEVYAPKK